MYRQALALRHRLLSAEGFTWVEGGDEFVLHFARGGSWQSVTNFGPDPVDLPPGVVLMASAELDKDRLPPDTTAWIAPPD
jgi:alpha-glucosidase